MAPPENSARALLTRSGLRVTGPRLAVVRVLLEADRPLSHSDVLKILGEVDWDPATVFRNLVKLRDAGVTSIVSRANGIDRYALSSPHGNHHQHPHFECDDCGQLTCLDIRFQSPKGLDGAWANAVKQASIQLRGQCPDCA